MRSGPCPCILALVHASQLSSMHPSHYPHVLALSTCPAPSMSPRILCPAKAPAQQAHICLHMTANMHDAYPWPHDMNVWHARMQEQHAHMMHTHGPMTDMTCPHVCEHEPSWPS